MRRHQTSRPPLWALGAGLAAALSLGTLSLTQVLGAGGSSPRSIANVAALPPAKQTVIARPRMLQAAALAGPRPASGYHKPNPVPAAARAFVTPVSGDLMRTVAGTGTIVETTQGPFSASTFQVQNEWYEDTNGASIGVYAGTLGQDPSQSAVFVIVEGVIPGITSGVYDAPAKGGAVRIVGATGNTLSLRAADGTTVTFDVTTHTFGAP